MPATATDRLTGVTTSVAVKAPVRAVFTTPITLTGLQGGLSAGDRALVAGQSNSVENGIYDASTSGWVRATDFDGARDVVNGTLVVQLLANGNGAFYQANGTDPIYPGTSPITFTLRDNPNITYPQTATEIAASITPTNTAYPTGDLRRYGCDVTGGTDNSTHIQHAITAAMASGGVGYIYHPGGTIAHASQIVVPSGLTVLGLNRVESIFKFTGSPAGSPTYTRSAWRYAGVAPWSGYANVAFRHVQIYYQNTVNFAAAIELAGWGWAYFEVEDVWIKGGCAYGIVLDGVEICSVHHSLIENTNATGGMGLWLVNGNDRGFTQGAGFTNVVSIRDNQISGQTGMAGIIDDGGNEHTITGNNFNQQSYAAQFCDVNSLVLSGNSFETTLQTGSYNVVFTNVSFGGTTKGSCTNGVVHANTFAGNMLSGSCLVFFGAMHYGFHITGNTFGSLFGRGNAIDVSKLGNSFCGYNYDLGSSSMAHYGNVHNDSDGNTLLPPQKGAFVSWTIKGQTFGDQRTATLFNAATINKLITVPYVVVNGVSGLTFNAAAGNSFDITVTGASGFTINAPLGDAPAHDFWTISTVYTAGALVLDATNQNIYVCTVGGTSSGSGTGPSGTTPGAAITDGTVTWNYVSGTISTLTAGQQITIHINNTSGGAMGTITWNAVFKMSAWTNPANGQNRSITFEYNGTAWKQVSQTGVDVPN